jgi:hypothetical protein
LPNGIRAGYLLSLPDIETGGMTLANLNIDAALQIPFDQRAATVSLDVGSAELPVTLAIGIYGGTCYFGMALAGDRLVSIDANFAYGLIGDFSLVAIEGTGRITLGVGYHQSGAGMMLEGTFFAGGQASVFDIITIEAALSVSLGYAGQGASSGVAGSGDFSVTVGFWPAEFSLSFPVGYAQSNSSSRGALDVASPKVPVGDQTYQPVDVFTSDNSWRAIRKFFAPATLAG